MLDASQPMRLQSYLCGAWRDGRGAYKPLLDAATGAVVAQIDATGLDMAEALDAWPPRRGRVARHDGA